MNPKNSILAYLLLVVLFCFSSSGISQKNEIWKKIDAPNVDRTNKIEYSANVKNFDSYILHKHNLVAALAQAPYRFSNAKSNTIVEFPNSNGNLEPFTMYETSVMSPALADKFPNIKTYIGVSLDNLANSINLTLTPNGVFGMIQHSGSSFFINPQSYHGSTYMVFEKNQAFADHLNAFACEVEGMLEDEAFNWSQSTSNNLVNDTTLKRYRLALACTSQYADFHIAQAGLASSAPIQEKLNAVLAAMVVTMNRVNSIYEREVAVTLQLIDDNEDLIQLDSATDPYTNNDVFEMLDENQTAVDNTIGSPNYDIGHVFSTGGGGVAALGSVCDFFFKANGVTGLNSPVGDPFDVDYVAHEMGHQFGANHTYNNSCGGNRNNSTAFEPGSGSTIMAYANICPPNVQSASDDYFHIASVSEMYNFITDGSGSNCSENIVLSNTPPTITAPLQNYTIPTGTAFYLEVQASDADGDALTYCWEQLDNQISTQPPSNFSTSGPNFRSLLPSSSPRRYFPELNTVLNGSLSNEWEVIPSLAREMEFSVLVRDNNIEGGQSVFDTTDITFVSGSPFSVTSQNTTGIVWEEGETETITWNVANTDSAPVNSPEVDILLSTNVNQDFDVVLASGVPNNGSADIVVPSVYGPFCRVMVKGSNNIFYAVNAENFVINSDVDLECFDEANSNVVEIPDGIGQNQEGEMASSTLEFTQNSLIETIAVQLDITHSYIQDLVIQLLGPDDQVVTLFDRNCGSESGIVVQFTDDGAPLPDECPNPFSGIYQPANGDLSQWIGTPATGEWTLQIQDYWNEDTGQLNSWSIEICTSNLSIINQEANEFSIVPNPNNGNFQINFSRLTGSQLTGKLYNLQGKLIENINLQPGRLQQDIQLNSLQHGMYLLQINDGENNLVEKLIIR